MYKSLLFLSLWALQIPGHATDQSIIIHVKNSQTNKAVNAYSIRFIGENENGQSYQLQSRSPVTQQLYLIPEGKYFIRVESDGYKPMDTRLTIDSSIRMINFEMLADQSTLEFSATYIKSRRKPGYSFLSGFISNESSLFPVAGAAIKNKDGQLLAITNEKGYYECQLPWTSIENDLLVSKPGFTENSFHLSRLCDGDDQVNNISLADMGNAAVSIIRIADHPVNGENSFASRPLTTNCLTNINVGRNCSCHTCTSIDVVDIETYTKRVLIKEWLSCWGSQTGGLNSLQAGAVAIRSYAMQRVYVHLAAHGSYDICETTCCQVYGTTQTLNGNTATDNTAKYILENGSGNIVQAEYAAEQNNHSGCGNCNTGDGATYACQADSVCCDETFNGHGRGMCQNGSARWATGMALTSSTCSFGATHRFGAQVWQWILNHYYPTYFIVQCQDIVTGVPDINGLEEFSVYPNPSNGQFSIKSKFNSPKQVSFRIFNVFGQLVYRSENNHLSGSQIKEIDTRNWMGGVYLLEMEVDAKRITKKIVVSSN